MSALRGFVYRNRIPKQEPWIAEVGMGSWRRDGDGRLPTARVGFYKSRLEALAAVCYRLKQEAVVADIVRRAEGKR